MEVLSDQPFVYYLGDFLGIYETHCHSHFLLRNMIPDVRISHVSNHTIVRSALWHIWNQCNCYCCLLLCVDQSNGAKCSLQNYNGFLGKYFTTPHIIQLSILVYLTFTWILSYGSALTLPLHSQSKVSSSLLQYNIATFLYRFRYCKLIPLHNYFKIIHDYQKIIQGTIQEQDLGSIYDCK